MRTLTLVALVATTLLSPLAAAADEPVDDWRTTACTDVVDMGRAGPPESAVPSGPSTLVASDRVAVRGLPGVLAGVDRIDFSGVTCEVFYIDGALPRDAVVDVSRNKWCAAFDRALDGKEQGDGGMCSSAGSPRRLYARAGTGAPANTMVLAVMAFRAHWSEVLKDRPGTPASWVGKTLTSDHAGSRWTWSLAGTTGVRHEFDRSRATDRAARAAHDRKVARATRDFEVRRARIEDSHRSPVWKALKISQARAERRDATASARRVLRLALHGIRLVVRDFHAQGSGSLPPVA